VVPPSVFSEAMRDIDLFVTMTSITTGPGQGDPGQGQAG
jgi:hypothetical protein